MKPMYCNGTNRHMDERSQNIYPFKKRKFFCQNPPCTSDGGDNRSIGETMHACNFSFLVVFCLCLCFRLLGYIQFWLNGPNSYMQQLEHHPQ